MAAADPGPGSARSRPKTRSRAAPRPRARMVASTSCLPVKCRYNAEGLMPTASARSLMPTLAKPCLANRSVAAARISSRRLRGGVPRRTGAGVGIVTLAGPSAEEAAAADHGLGADVVGLGDAEQVDGARRVGRGPGAAGRDDLLHPGEQAGVDPVLDLLALHVDGGVPVGRRFGEPGLDQAEPDRV